MRKKKLLFSGFLLCILKLNYGYSRLKKIFLFLLAEVIWTFFTIVKLNIVYENLFLLIVCKYKYIIISNGVI